MHTRWIGGFALMVFLAASSALQAQETKQSAGPRMEIAQERFEFEPVPEGAEIIHEFRVKNSGEAPLRIERVRTG